MTSDALIAAAVAALKEARYDISLGELDPKALDDIRTANSKVLHLELFVLTTALVAAKLPRYAAALEMHATVAEKTAGSAEVAAVPQMRSAVAGLKAAIKAVGEIKTEATDMAKKLDRFSDAP